jgi:hypothetical protein
LETFTTFVIFIGSPPFSRVSAEIVGIMPKAHAGLPVSRPNYYNITIIDAMRNGVHTVFLDQKDSILGLTFEYRGPVGNHVQLSFSPVFTKTSQNAPRFDAGSFIYQPGKP